MRKKSHYGKIGIVNLPEEVKYIWYSRDIEPKPCEPVNIYWPINTDANLLIRQDFVSRLVARTPLTENEEKVVVLCVLDDCTALEASKEIGRSVTRVRQLLMKAMMKFRKELEIMDKFYVSVILEGGQK